MNIVVSSYDFIWAVELNLYSANIKEIGYQGYIILQTARAKNNDHLEVLAKYKKFVKENLK